MFVHKPGSAGEPKPVRRSQPRTHRPPSRDLVAQPFSPPPPPIIRKPALAPVKSFSWIGGLVAGVVIGSAAIGALVVPLSKAFAPSGTVVQKDPEEKRPIVKADSPQQKPPQKIEPAPQNHEPEIKPQEKIEPKVLKPEPAPPPTPIELLHVEAMDGSFSVELPRGWKVKSAVWTNFSAEGPDGEVVFSKGVNVPATQQSYAIRMIGMRSQLQSGQITQESYLQASRMFSAPLPPEKVLTDFVPHVLPHVSGMTILASGDPNRIIYEGMGVGLKEKVFHYRYTDLNKNYDIEGASQISTASIPGTSTIKSWTFTSTGFEAPETLFKSRSQLYLRIMGTYHERPDAIRQISNSIAWNTQRFIDKMDEAQKVRQAAWQKLLDATSRPIAPQVSR